MDRKYHKYTVEDFIQEPKFIAWVKRRSEQKYWNSFLREHPEQVKNVETARKIVESFRYSNIDVNEKEMQSVWKNIELYYDLQQKTGKKIKFRKITRYAAMVAFLLTVGTLVSHFLFEKNRNQFTEIEIPFSNSTEAKLILSGGEEILLKEKQTELQFDDTGKKIKIDRDSIVDYQPEDIKNTMAQVIIPYGKRSDIQLSDGTKVWLNAGSRLIFPQKFTGKERHVFLKGEAYFEVTKNRNAPFIVTTDNMNVTVLGTEFNIKDNNSDNELEVVLVKGEVSLKENSVLNFLGKEVKLIPNQKAVYDKIDNKMVIESEVDVAYFTSWKEGLLEFRRESILNVFKQLSKYYNVRFVTESSVELNRKISGKLDLKESLEEVLKVVSDAAPITYRIDEGKVVVNSKISYLPVR